jgi:YHS domain-containing protein
MILKLIFGIFVAYLLYKLIKAWNTVKGPSKADLPTGGEDLVEDPFCHTYVPVSHACRIVIDDGKTVYFCSQKCLETYKKERKL